MSKKSKKKLAKDFHQDELERLQIELVKLQYHIRTHGLKVAVIFEGRDAAGKGGLIKRIVQRLNPRVAHIVALPKPTDEQKSQWYFQRYIEHLPASGELVLFDRSWYNRAGVEPVMGFCTEDEHKEFLRAVPEFERMLQNAGIILLKYWLQVSDDVQEKRFRERLSNPLKRWKLSSMDVEARKRWYDYARARDEMFKHSDVSHSPWYYIDADDKDRARLTCIRHILSQIPYDDELPKRIKLPRLQDPGNYKTPKKLTAKAVPNYYK
jgi:polyphosphate kinase 2